MTISLKYRQTGFTLAEISIAMAVLMIVGGVAYSVLTSSTTLLAKNVSLNSSNIIVRSALDRIYSEINQSYGFQTTNPAIPKPPCSLVNADGTPANALAPAAGILFDRYLGGPYIVGNPGAGLTSATTTFKLYYSTDALANPPAPAKNDVVIMDGSTRALVDSSTAPSTSFSSPIPSPTPNPGKMVTVTLQNTLGSYTNPPGTGITWTSTSQQTAYVLHRKAFVVVPVNGIQTDPQAASGQNGPPAELRMYPDAEKLTEIINDSSKYVVLTREIGTNKYTDSLGNTLMEHLPFSLFTQNPNTASAATFLNIAMRVEDQKFNKRLASQQAREFNTFLRVDTMLRPRSMP